MRETNNSQTGKIERVISEPPSTFVPQNGIDTSDGERKRAYFLIQYLMCKVIKHFET